MPIGTVYRAPPRKRSNHNLSNSNSSASGGAANEQPQSPTSPTLPAGRAQSDLEARIAEFNVAAAGATSPPPRPDQGYAPPRPASGSLPPKAPTSPMAPGARSVGAPVNNDGQYRNSAPAAQPEGQYYGGAAEPPRAETLRARNQPRPVAPAAPEPRAAPVRTAPVRAAPAPAMQTAVGTGQILIVYYSMYGHVRLLAESVREGIESVPGCTAEILRVPETLSPDVLRKMNAPAKNDDPELTYDQLDKLREASGVMFGIPTRFGMMPAQMKQLFDSTVKLWTKGDLVGKPAGLFFSSATQGGGQETTALTTITQLVHHGMIYVPPGYSFGGAMFDNSEVHGGSPYGCGTVANGDGSRLPSKYELDFARHQGAQFASVALKLSQ